MCIRDRIPSASGAKPQVGTTSISPASSPRDGLHPIPLVASCFCQCPLWVIRCVADQRRRSWLSVVGPIAAKILQCRECSEVPLANNAPQQKKLFDHFIGALLKLQRYIESKHLGGLEINDEV